MDRIKVNPQRKSNKNIFFYNNLDLLLNSLLLGLTTDGSARGGSVF